GLLACLRVSDSHCSGGVARRDAAAVGAEGDAPNPFLIVAAQYQELLTRIGVPHPDRRVAPGRDDPSAIGTEVHGDDTAGMSTESRQYPTGGRVQEPYGIGDGTGAGKPATRGKAVSVGAEADGKLCEGERLRGVKFTTRHRIPGP